MSRDPADPWFALRALSEAVEALYASFLPDQKPHDLDEPMRLAREALAPPTAAEERCRSLSAQLAIAHAALKPFADFDLTGFRGEVLEVVPSSPDNPSRRIEPIWTVHFRKAREALAAADGVPDEMVAREAEHAEARALSERANPAGEDPGAGSADLLGGGPWPSTTGTSEAKSCGNSSS